MRRLPRRSSANRSATTSMPIRVRCVCYDVAGRCWMAAPSTSTSSPRYAGRHDAGNRDRRTQRIGEPAVALLERPAGGQLSVTRERAAQVSITVAVLRCSSRGPAGRVRATNGSVFVHRVGIDEASPVAHAAFPRRSIPRDTAAMTIRCSTADESMGTRASRSARNAQVGKAAGAARPTAQPHPAPCQRRASLPRSAALRRWCGGRPVNSAATAWRACFDALVVQRASSTRAPRAAASADAARPGFGAPRPARSAGSLRLRQHWRVQPEALGPQLTPHSRFDSSMH